VIDNVVTSLTGTGNYVGIQVSQSQVTQQRLVIEENIVTLNGGGEGIRLLNTTGASIVNDSVQLTNGTVLFSRGLYESE